MFLLQPLVMIIQLMGLWQWSKCVPPYKNMHSLVGGCTTGYIGILWKVLGILLSGEMVYLEKHLLFFHCYRLALERASNCKTLLQCMTGQFSIQFSLKGRLKITRLKVSLMVGLVLDVSIARSLASYHITI